MFRSRTERRKRKVRKKKIQKAQELSGSQLAIAFRRFRKNKAGLFGLILTVTILFLGVFADFLSPYDPLEQMSLYYNYQPWYQPPGETEGALFVTNFNRLMDNGFESNLGIWFGIGAGWSRINITEEGYPTTTSTGTYAIIADAGGVEVSQDIASTEDLWFTDIRVYAYLDGNEPTTLEFILTYPDDSDPSVIYLTVDQANQWQSLRVNIGARNPDTFIISRLDTGSPVLLDRVEFRGGEYFSNLHVLGTNRQSQDLFAKLIFGTRVTLIVSVGAIIISLIIGLPLGLVAGYFRGRIDELIMRITDLFLTLPFYFVMILAIVLIGQTQWLDNLIISLGLSAEVIIFAVTIGLGLFGWMGITRLIRATILQVREMDYVEAARALGASNKRIMLIHVLPNILAPLIVAVTYNLAVNIVAEAGLAFLGYTDESLASWGRELYDGFGIVTDAWWAVLFPAMLIIAAVMAFNLFGDGLRDAFDPRIR
jgi:peptide/nickel transport system permease protein